MKKNKQVSIVIPCYNEEKNLKNGVLDDVYKFLSQQKYLWEVIVCDDASTDNSFKIAKKYEKKYENFKVLNLPHGGKPSAVWAGIKKAKYNIVLFTDMDQSTPLSELNKLLPHFEKGFDVVIGSRGAVRQGNSFIRKLMANIFLNFRRLMVLPKIVDTQCGFKAINTNLAKKIFPCLAYFQDKSNKSGWRVSAFDVELLFIAQVWGHKIKEVIVKWKDEDLSDTKGNKFDRFKKESVTMAKEIFRIKSNEIKGYYKN
jgi:dolichyl-phosphate beta-glucosyltransferase